MKKNQTLNFPKTVMGFYIRNFWRYSGVFVLLFAVFAVLDITGLYILPSFFLKRAVFVLENTPAAMALSAIIPIAVTYLVLRIAQWCASMLRWTIFDGYMRYKAYNRISEDLYDYVFRQNIEFYSNTMPGKINSQINQIGIGFYTTMGIAFGEFLAVIVSAVIVVASLSLIGWQYTVLIVIAAAFRLFWGLATVKKALRASADRANSLNNLHGRLLDAVSNFPVVKLFARAKYEQQAVKGARHKYATTARNAHFWSRFFWAPGNFAYDIIGFTVLLILCGYMFSIGQSTIADISFAIAIYISFGVLGFNLIVTIKEFTDSYGDAVGSYNNLIKPLAIVDIPNAPPLMVRKGKIEIKNLSFKYRRAPVLENINLVIQPGEKIGIVGFSGAGKTTFVNLLMRLYDPEKGGIYIDGQNIRDVTQDSLRENIAFIPQEPTMFNRTLAENIGYGKIDANMREIKRVARLANADKFINDTPKKYDSLVGDRGIKLSGGQRQRIAIARAFLKNAPILILDEATAALDSDTEATIQKSFAELSAGRTTIAIAHRLSTLRNMDRIIVIDQGRLVEQGTHMALLRKKNGIYARLWKMQSGGFIQE